MCEEMEGRGKKRTLVIKDMQWGTQNQILKLLSIPFADLDCDNVLVCAADRFSFILVTSV